MDSIAKKHLFQNSQPLSPNRLLLPQRQTQLRMTQIPLNLNQIFIRRQNIFTSILSKINPWQIYRLSIIQLNTRHRRCKSFQIIYCITIIITTILSSMSQIICIDHVVSSKIICVRLQISQIICDIIFINFVQGQGSRLVTVVLL